MSFKEKLSGPWSTVDYLGFILLLLLMLLSIWTSYLNAQHHYDRHTWQKKR